MCAELGSWIGRSCDGLVYWTVERDWGAGSVRSCDGSVCWTLSWGVAEVGRGLGAVMGRCAARRTPEPDRSGVTPRLLCRVAESQLVGEPCGSPDLPLYWDSWEATSPSLRRRPRYGAPAAPAPSH